MLEHETVTRTVHGLQTVLGVIAVEQEHIVLVVICVARNTPQVKVEYVGSHDLLYMKQMRDAYGVTTLMILTTNELNQLVVDMSAMRQEEATTRTQFMEEEQVLLLA